MAELKLLPIRDVLSAADVKKLNRQLKELQALLGRQGWSGTMGR